MSKQAWKVVVTSSGGIDVQVPSGMEPLHHFFLEIPTQTYPRVLAAAADDVGYGLNEAGVSFPDDLDEDDEPLGKDEVEVYDFSNKIRIPAKDFLMVLRDAADMLLKAKAEGGDAESAWGADMKKGIEALNKRLAS